MHELSLVQSIFSSLEAELAEAELRRMCAVDLKIGRLANVEPTLLQNAFKAYQAMNPTYDAVELNIQLIEIEVRCPQCGSISPVEQYRFICGQCETPTRDIIAGEELLIHRIHYADVPVEADG